MRIFRLALVCTLLSGSAVRGLQTEPAPPRADIRPQAARCRILLDSSETDIASAQKLHHIASRMVAAADTAAGSVSSAFIALYGSHERDLSSFYLSAAEVEKAAVRLDPWRAEYRLLLAKLLWRQADRPPYEFADYKPLAREALVEAKCALQLARPGDEDTLDYANYLVREIEPRLRRW